jgi:tetratricopeptide (TPR) repeat protein
VRFEARVPAFLFLIVILAGCPSAPGPVSDPAPDPVPPGNTQEDLRTQVELGTPSSLARSAELIRNRQVSAEESRSLNAAARALASAVYPDIPLSFSGEASGGHLYSRILRDVERGVYTAPAANSRDFLELILPFLAYYNRDVPGNQLRNALPHLEKAAQLNGNSALPPLFQGLVYERTGDPSRAEENFRQALDISAECYPAELGLVRILHSQGKAAEELSRLTALLSRYPGNVTMTKQLARLYADRRDWSRADALITEILRKDSRDGEFILLRAKILLDQGLFQQAQVPLDTYASINSTNKQYLFLRARVQAEGYRNREAAINYLRPLIRSNPDDGELLLYLASLLIESPRTADNDEGRAMILRLVGGSTATPDALSLLAVDSIRRENWREAKIHIDRLLALRRNSGDLLNAYKIEQALGNYAAALSHARELYNRDTANEEAGTAYITALIDTGRQNEAARIVDQRLSSVPAGVQKSKYYFLRSKLRSNDDAVMNDLRSALFEDPRNLDALIALFEIYHRRKDERRAVYYLRQALAIAPNNPALKRYETEYRSALGN